MIILDTNVVSELMRPKPSARVAAWVARQPAGELFTTTITEGEIFYGIELLAKSRRREGLLAAAEAMFAEDFEGRICGFDSASARVFAAIAARRRALGKPISHADAQIAAIAQARGATLATHNVNDFEDYSLERPPVAGRPRNCCDFRERSGSFFLVVGQERLAGHTELRLKSFRHQTQIAY